MKIRSSKRRRGSATVEMAIVLPLLFSIGLICCDLGRFCHRYIAVINAARAGAGYAAMHRVPGTKANWDAAVSAAIVAELSNNSWFDASKLTIAEPTSTAESLSMRVVKVEVSYPFDTVIPWPVLPGYNTTRNLKHVVVTRAIR